MVYILPDFLLQCGVQSKIWWVCVKEEREFLGRELNAVIQQTKNDAVAFRRAFEDGEVLRRALANHRCGFNISTAVHHFLFIYRKEMVTIVAWYLASEERRRREQKTQLNNSCLEQEVMLEMISLLSASELRGFLNMEVVPQDHLKYLLRGFLDVSDTNTCCGFLNRLKEADCDGYGNFTVFGTENREKIRYFLTLIEDRCTCEFWVGELIGGSDVSSLDGFLQDDLLKDKASKALWGLYQQGTADRFWEKRAPCFWTKVLRKTLSCGVGETHSKVHKEHVVRTKKM